MVKNNFLMIFIQNSFVEANAHGLADRLSIATIEQLVQRPPVSKNGALVLDPVLEASKFQVAVAQRLLSFSELMQTAATLNIDVKLFSFYFIALHVSILFNLLGPLGFAAVREAAGCLPRGSRPSVAQSF